ncbi:MAG: hypothetical protein KJ874_06580, partial [Acidobacteria bacterium]|nr:hypothetical protein [Acidobacteriota bacterium]
KAVKLDPQNYFIHLILAEAYWQKGVVDEAIHEYRIGFNKPSLSDDLIHQIASKPQLFAVWEVDGTWHFMWRSENNIQFSGKIYFDQKIKDAKKHHFSQKDALNQIKEHAAEFNVSTGRRRIKTLDINIGKKSVLTCYIKMDGQFKKDDIVLIHSGKNPKEIPFTLSSDGMN